VTVQVGAYTLRVLGRDGALLATHRRRFGSRRTDRIDPRTPRTRLARNPGAWPNSLVRAEAPVDLRTRLDPDARDARRAVLQVWATLHGQYGEAVALQALTEAVQRGRAVVADATVLAARLATWGPDRPADPGPDLPADDAALLPQGVRSCSSRRPTGWRAAHASRPPVDGCRSAHRP
jgi:hypothetical protein